MTYSEAQLDLIKRTYAKNATDDEFRMFISFCADHDLDPENKEIDFVKYPIKIDGVPTGEYTVSFQPSVKGLMKKARRHEDYRGIISCAVREKDTFKADMPNHIITHKFASHKRGGVVGAWAKLEREGMKPFMKYILLEEFYKKNNFWDNNTSDMTEKTARKKVLNEAYGLDDVYLDGIAKPISGLLAESIGIPIPDLLPMGTTDHEPGSIEDVFEKMENLNLPDEHPIVNTEVRAHSIETFSEDSRPPNYEDGTVLESTTQVFSFDDLPKKEEPEEIQIQKYKYDEFDGIKYFYDTMNPCMTCGKERLCCGGTGSCWDCDHSEKKKILLKNKDPVDQLDDDIDQMDLSQDLTNPDSLSAQTKAQLGDDWYCSLTFKTQAEHDVPLHHLRYIVDTFSKSPGSIEAFYQERLKTKPRQETLLSHYYDTLKHTKIDLSEIVPAFIAQMDKTITTLVNLVPSQLSEDDAFNIIRDEMKWSNEWTEWAMIYLKKRGHLS